jgi:small-conductance mechanosensitive channel
MNRSLNLFLVFTVTLVVTAPFSFFGFALALIVAEAVIYPTATLVTAVVAGLVASWTATTTARDGSRTDIGAVARRSVTWAIIPAAISPLLFQVVSRNIFGLLLVLLYTTLVATSLAFRLRTEESSTRRELRITAAWVGGTVIAIVLIITVAGMFGLAGA